MPFELEVLLLTLALLLVPAILVVSAYQLYEAKKNWLRLLSVIPVGIFLSLSFFLYEAIFPFEDFYIERWKENTNINFPESANIIHKSAGFPDTHGSYAASLVFELTKQDYEDLLFKVQQQHNYEEANCDASIYTLPNHFMPKKQHCYSFLLSKPVTVSFLNDRKTVVFQKFD